MYGPPLLIGEALGRMLATLPLGKGFRRRMANPPRRRGFRQNVSRLPLGEVLGEMLAASLGDAIFFRMMHDEDW